MNTTNIILILTNIPILLVALYAGRYFYQLGKELRIFSGFLFLSVFIQIPSLILYLLKINNMPLLHIYTMAGGYLIIHFYQELLKEYLTVTILKWVARLFVLFILFDSLFLENIFTFNPIGLSVEAVIIVILALSTFNLLLREKTEFQNKELRRSFNWINSGFFIYFCSNLLLHYFGDYLMHSPVSNTIFRNVWMLHSLFSITMYICFFTALWKSPKH
jgi:hypothetical protein